MADTEAGLPQRASQPQAERASSSRVSALERVAEAARVYVRAVDGDGVADTAGLAEALAVLDGYRGEAANRLEALERVAEAMRQIAAPRRPDGTYNLSREACEQIARAALAVLDTEEGR